MKIFEDSWCMFHLDSMCNKNKDIVFKFKFYEKIFLRIYKTFKETMTQDYNSLKVRTSPGILTFGIQAFSGKGCN